MSKNPEEKADRFAMLGKSSFKTPEKKEVEERKAEPAKEPITKTEEKPKEETIKVTTPHESKPEKKEKPAEKKKTEKEEKADGALIPTTLRLTEEQRNSLLKIALKKSLQENKKITMADLMKEAIETFIKKNKELL